MTVNNSDIEIIFQNTGSFIGRFVKASGLLYFIDFISLSNKSFKNLTCVGKVQCCFESILFQRFDIYIFLFSYLKFPSFYYELKEGLLETVRCDISFHVRS